MPNPIHITRQRPAAKLRKVGGYRGFTGVKGGYGSRGETIRGGIERILSFLRLARTCFTWVSRSLSGLSSAKSHVGEPERFGDPVRWRFFDFGELDRDPLLLMLLGDRINAILSKKSSLKEPTRRANLLTPIRDLGLLQSLVVESSA